MRNSIPAPLWRLMRNVGTAVLTPIRFSMTTGHGRSSLAAKAVGSDGQVLPWYTYPAIQFLANRDASGLTVLEFGGGQSTLWWARRAARVVCIEQDKGWHDQISGSMPANVELHHVALEDFDDIEGLLKSKGVRFDVVIVDGHRRREATRLAQGFLADQAVAILDNAEGYDFQEETADWPMSRVDFYGFAPGVSRQHCTSMLFTAGHPFVSPRNPIARIDPA